MSAIFLTKHTVADRPASTYFFHETKGGVMAASVLIEPQRNAIKQDGPPVASLHEVTKKFGGQVALDRFSLQLHAGEVVALLGPNGAGKTTAVRLLLGLSQTTSGEVKIFGGNPRDRASRLRLGAMLQVGRVP
jgi:ABC-2 type transport system ATP-binding protein